MEGNLMFMCDAFFFQEVREVSTQDPAICPYPEPEHYSPCSSIPLPEDPF